MMRLADLGDYVVPLTLRAVCDLGIADLLAQGPRPVDELAAEAGAHPAALCRALRALACKGIFTEPQPAVFALTPLAEPLRSDHALSLRETYTLLEADVEAWAKLGQTLRTGRPAFDLAHDQGYWSYLQAHPAQSARVDRWMESVNRLHLRTLLPAYPWRELSTVVDVGGGNGAFLSGLLARHRQLRGVLFDLPHVVADAPRVLSETGTTDRCEIRAGSFFDAVPAGGDGYLLKTVLPGFDDDDATLILARVRAAMRGESRLLLLEAVLPPGDTFDVAKLYDVHTMVMTGGGHRTREHTETLLAEVGLGITQVVATPTLTVLEARPADQVRATPVSRM